MMPDKATAYCIFGDAAYPQSAYLIGGFLYPPPNSDKAAWNTVLSKVRICVEWGFKEIVKDWCYLDFKASMKIFETPIAQ